MGNCKLYLRGAPFGEVYWEKAGLMTEFTAHCPIIEKEIARAAVFNREEKYLMIGVMYPKNGMLYAKKRFSEGEIKKAITDVDSIYRAEIVCSNTPNSDKEETEEKGPQYVKPKDVRDNDDSWSKVIDVSSITADVTLKKILIHSKTIMIKENNNGYLIAAPIFDKSGFELAPFFSLAAVCKIKGRLYAVVKTDKNNDVQKTDNLDLLLGNNEIFI